MLFDWNRSFPSAQGVAEDEIVPKFTDLPQQGPKQRNQGRVQRRGDEFDQIEPSLLRPRIW